MDIKLAKQVANGITQNITIGENEIKSLLVGIGLRETQTRLLKSFIPNQSKVSGFGEFETIKTYTGASVVNWIKLYRKDGDTSERPLVILPIVVIKVGLDTTVVKTQLTGRIGTVKEIITTGDWNISIDGILFNYDNITKMQEFPKEKIKELRQVMERGEVLSVVSPYLNDIFEIYQIVIENGMIEQIDTSNNSVRFSINAVSDKPLELTL